ncbi:MAG: hypothetical protein M0Q93_07175 [Terrimicrobiaceae bacterium]|nr:hypothetical protein [Terrimicrobiaceae bacterium]
MNESLKIECGEWWGSSNGEKDISQVCRAPIGITVGEDCLTRLEDSWGNTVRKRMHVSAYTLAEWFAGNWWRLRWEPETPAPPWSTRGRWTGALLCGPADLFS